MLPYLPQLRPGQQPTADEWNRLVAHLGRLGSVSGTAFADIGVARTAGGVQVLDGRSSGHWGKIGTGSGFSYAHQQAVRKHDQTGWIDRPPGDSTSIWGTATVNPAREVNGRTDVPAGTYVWLWPDPSAQDKPGFLFSAPPAAGGGDVPCNPCGWLRDAEALGLSGRALRVRVLPGSGRCACIAGQGLDDLNPWLAINAGGSVPPSWVLTHPLVTCCGCGTLVIDQTPAGADPLAATLTDTSDCPNFDPDTPDPGGSPYTYDLTFECCGQGTAAFSGGGRQNCDGWVPFSQCDNSFLVTVECVDCTLLDPVCAACPEGHAPYSVHVVAAGFSGANAVYNGDWVLPTTGCVSTNDCSPSGVVVTSTIAGGVVTVTFSGGGGGGATYAFSLGAGMLCVNSFPLARTAGDAGTTPATLPWDALSCNRVRCADISPLLKVAASSDDVACIDGWGKNLTFTPGAPATWDSGNTDPPCTTDTGFAMHCTTTDGVTVITGTWNDCACDIVAVTARPFSITFKHVGACLPATAGGTIFFVVTDQ